MPPRTAGAPGPISAFLSAPNSLTLLFSPGPEEWLPDKAQGPPGRAAASLTPPPPRVRVCLPTHPPHSHRGQLGGWQEQTRTVPGARLSLHALRKGAKHLPTQCRQPAGSAAGVQARPSPGSGRGKDAWGLRPPPCPSWAASDGPAAGKAWARLSYPSWGNKEVRRFITWSGPPNGETGLLDSGEEGRECPLPRGPPRRPAAPPPSTGCFLA